MSHGRNPVFPTAQLLLSPVLLLVALGVVMLFSTAAFGADVRADDLYFDAKRQLFWLSLGIVACCAFALLDYRTIRPWVWPVYGLAALLLVGCFLPTVGQEINGERRWISAAGFRLQPSEFAKLALIFTLAAWFGETRNSKPETRNSKPETRAFGPKTGAWRGFLVPAAISAFILGLIAAEVDIGTTAVLAAVSFGLMFAAGSHRRWLLGGVSAAILALGAQVLLVPGRLTRVMALLHPEQYADGVGHQQAMAKLAFGSGGTQGLGLGEGRLKMLYMPFAHTDFIFPMIGEELGLVGTLTVVVCFAIFTVAGLSVARRAPDRFGRLLGAGVVLSIAIQAALNIAVTTAVFPNTGLPLPFVSYGGSNLVCSLVGVGLLLSIHRQTQRQPRSQSRIPPVSTEFRHEPEVTVRL